MFLPTDFALFKKIFLHNFQQRHHERFSGLSFMHTFSFVALELGRLPGI